MTITSQEMYLIAFSCLSCLAAGMFLAVTVADIKDFPDRSLLWGAILSLVLMGAGGAAGTMNLGHPEMVLAALSRPESNLFLEFASAIAFCCLLVIYIFVVFRGLSETFRKIVACLCALCAVLLLFALGKNFYMEWRPAWSTYTLVLPFIGWGLAVGGFVLGIFNKLKDEDEDYDDEEEVKLPVGLIAIAGCCAAIIFTLAYFGALAISDQEEAVEAFDNCVSGAYLEIFWGALVACGFVIPFVLALISRARSIWINIICIIFTLIGAGTYQWLLFQLGTASWQFFKR